MKGLQLGRHSWTLSTAGVREAKWKIKPTTTTIKTKTNILPIWVLNQCLGRNWGSEIKSSYRWKPKDNKIQWMAVPKSKFPLLYEKVKDLLDCQFHVASAGELPGDPSLSNGGCTLLSPLGPLRFCLFESHLRMGLTLLKSSKCEQGAELCCSTGSSSTYLTQETSHLPLPEQWPGKAVLQEPSTWYYWRLSRRGLG